MLKAYLEFVLLWAPTLRTPTFLHLHGSMARWLPPSDDLILYPNPLSGFRDLDLKQAIWQQCNTTPPSHSHTNAGTGNANLHLNLLATRFRTQ